MGVTDPDPAPSLETPVEYVVFPTTFGLRAGTLRLADGRLSFVRDRGDEVVFDAPVGEFHSFAPAHGAAGFHLWHGDRRHRFVFQRYRARTPSVPGFSDAAAAARDLGIALNDLADAKAMARLWERTLAPLIGSPPAGLRVRPPLQGAAYILAVVGFVVGGTLLVVAIVVAVVLLGG